MTYLLYDNISKFDDMQSFIPPFLNEYFFIDTTNIYASVMLFQHVCLDSLEIYVLW